MIDRYDRLYENISKKIPHTKDKELLKKLLDKYKDNGKDGLDDYITTMINKILEGESKVANSN